MQIHRTNKRGKIIFRQNRLKLQERILYYIYFTHFSIILCLIYFNYLSVMFKLDLLKFN